MSQVRLRSDEQQFFDELLSDVDPGKSGLIRGPAVKKLFPLSGLPKQALAKVHMLLL